MKVLHIITSLHTGGAEKLVVEFAARFRELGHEVGVVVFNGADTPFMKRLEGNVDVKIYKLGTSVYNPLYIFRLLKIIRQYDIIHTHNTSPQIYAAIANLICRKTLITTEHNTTNRRRNWWWYKWIDRWVYKQYDKIICISDKAEENLRNYLGVHSSNVDDNSKLNKKVLTIYNGVNIEAFHSASVNEELRKGISRFVVVMVAAFRPQKDQDTLVKAIAKLPKEKFALWLVGDGERIDSIKQLVADLKVSDSVTFFGNRTDVPQILHTADIIVMSTHYEGLSLSNIEGMAAGKPFVASDVDGIHEVTKDYGVLVPHGDPEKLAEVIKDLSEDKAYYENVATRCYERAKQFDISETVKRYNKLYEQCSH